MAISDEIAVIERRLYVARVPLARVLIAADIDRSTWSRWRSDKVSPTLARWRAVNSAVDTLVASLSEPTNPTSGDTGAHTATSSSDPTSEILKPPSAVDAPTDDDRHRREASDAPT